MKSYYYFVRVPGRFGLNDVVYKVKVGTSMMEQSKLVLVQEFCKDCGLYFERVSTCSDQAIENLAKGLSGWSVGATNFIRFVSLSISECYQRIVDDRWSDIEDVPVEKPAFFRQLICHGISAYSTANVSTWKKVCPPVSRKNLSLHKDEQLHVALIGFGLILVVFLIAAHLEYEFAKEMPGWF